MPRLPKPPKPAPAPSGSAASGSARARRAGQWLRRAVFGVALIAVAAASGLVYVMWQIPLPPGEPPLLQTSYMCAADVSGDCTLDNSMAQLTGGVDRVSVDYEQVPTVFLLALLATEDRQFFEHAGVDPVAVARALVADLRNEPLRQGGSTITQQYVKNAYLSSERTWERKLREAVLAIKLERELPKQEILERYLNTIYWGRGAYGIQAASQAYFGVDVEQLGLAESAYLAGIIRAPEAADASLDPADPRFEDQRSAATARRSTVLGAMVDLGWITDAERDEVEAGGWDYVLTRTDQTNYGRVAAAEAGTEYFVDFTRRWLVDNGYFTDAQIYGGGLRIYTTLNLDYQQAAANAISSTLDRPDDPQAALVALDDNGGIAAMQGGFDFANDQVNLAAGTFGGGSGRQPGSSFKAITLATALQEGVPLSRTYQSPGRMTLPIPGGGTWNVGNYADGGLGTLNLAEATRISSNTAYAQLVLDVGASDVAAMANRMGIASEVPEVPAITLGAADVSVLDMATAFSVFSQRGELVGPWPVRKVTDANGTVLWEAPLERQRVLDPDVADTMNWVLRQVVESGTGTAASGVGQVVAGKTGTAENFRDAWFIGYTCRLTAGVWVGYAGPETRYMSSVHGIQVVGGTFPAQIWRKFMLEALPGLESCDFPRPRLANLPTDNTTDSTLEDPDATSTSTPRSTTSWVPITLQPTTSTTSSTTSTTTTTEPTTPTEPPAAGRDTGPPSAAGGNAGP